MPRTPRRPGDPPAKGRAQRKARRPKVPKEAPLDAHWDDFYARRGGRFYKDRHWLRRELPELMPDEVNSDPLKHQDELTSDGEAVRRDDAFPAARELGDHEMVGLEAGCGCGAAQLHLSMISERNARMRPSKNVASAHSSMVSSPSSPWT